MDYINIPRTLIYKERTDLKDFGVKEPGTMNHLLFSNLKDLFKSTDRLKELILRCFNNAYYICTIIPFEDFPETQVAEYEKLLLKDDPYDREEVCAVSMAMVCKLLPASDTRWMPENSDLIEQIRYRFTHYQWMNSGARKSFEFMEGKHNTDVLIIPPSEIVPRNIIEVIETFPEKDLMTYAEYICERLALVEDKQRQIHGSDMAIARIKDYQRELCEDYEYDPKKDSFNYSHKEGMPLIRDLSCEEKIRSYYKQSKKALDYYALHTLDYYEDGNHHEQQTDASVSFPGNTTLVAENEQLRQKLSHRDNEINELRKENDELKKKLAEKENENERLREKIRVLENELQPEEELSEEQKMGIDERIVLISTALGITLSQKDINQTQLAHTIAHFSGDNWRSIRSRIVKINSEILQESNTPGNGFSHGTSEAVKNVKEWLKKIGRAEIAPATQNLIKEIDDIYLNKKE